MKIWTIILIGCILYLGGTALEYIIKNAEKRVEIIKLIHEKDSLRHTNNFRADTSYYKAKTVALILTDNQICNIINAGRQGKKITLDFRKK